MITIFRDFPDRLYANLYVVLTSVLSLALLLWYPPLQSTHEWQHFLRGLTFSPLYKSGTLPSSIVQFAEGMHDTKCYSPETERQQGCRKLSHLALDDGNKVTFVSENNVRVYPFVDYLPQIMAGAAGEALQLAPLSIYYMTRFLCLLSGIVFGYIILRLLPAYQLPAMVALLLPSGWIMRAVQYPDYVIDIAAFLYFALLIRIVYYKLEINWKRVMAFTATGLILSLSKIIFFPLTLLVLLIPAMQFASLRHRAACMVVIIGTCFCASLINAVISCDNGFNMNIVNAIDSGKASTDSPGDFAETQKLLERPMDVLGTVINTYAGWAYWRHKIVEMFLWWNSFNRVLLTSGTFPLWIALSPCFLALTRNGTADETGGFTEGFQPSMAVRLFMLDLMLLMTIVIALALFIEHTPVNNPVVLGIQGRYFVPLLPLLIVCFSIRVPDKWFRPCIFFQSVASLAVLLILYGVLFRQWMMI